MPVGLLGRKIGMTQIYDDEGRVIPVTVIEAGPCQVLHVKTKDTDGYEAVQVGFDDKPRRLASRAERGHVTNLNSKRERKRKLAGVEVAEKAGPEGNAVEPKKFVREFRTDGEEHGLAFGQVLNVDHLDGLKFIDVIGTNKGRGTAGVMKRHNFAGQRASHGVKRVHRHPGSIGQSADPSRVMKGTKMAGRYGNARNTMRSLKIVQLDTEKNLVLVKGAVPGPNGGYVVLRHSTKRRRSHG